MAEKYYYNENKMKILGKREDEDKRRQEMMKLELFFKTILSEHILKKIKNQHIHFWVHDHSSWSTIGLHLVRDPKAFLIGP